MNYRHLSLHCDCGEVPERLVEVGFSEDHHLVVHWWCDKCEKVVYISKPLTECWQECPAADHSLERALAKWPGEAQEDADAEFLHSIGVTM